jgi:RNA recognition motif-containing protein
MHTLLVSNVPGNLGDPEFRRMFAPFGRVSRVMVASGPDGAGRWAFVEMDEDEGAAAARNALHDREVSGRRITVESYYPSFG